MKIVFKSKMPFILSARLERVLVAALFSVSYILIYTRFLNPWFEYAGFVLYKKSFLFILFSCIIAILPITFYRGYKTISSIISIFIYVLLYVPIILTFAMGANFSLFKILGIQLLFCCMMCLFFTADRFVFIRNFNNEKFAFLSDRFFLLLTIAITLFVLYIYKGKLAFMDFENVYEHRLDPNTVKVGAITGYLLSWFIYFFSPLCLVFGLVCKKKMYLITSVVASIVMYMAAANKMSILMPICLTGFYFLFSRFSINHIFSYVTLLFSSLMIVLLLISPQPGSVAFMMSTVLLWRTFGNGGYITLWYHDFFSNNPYTYYTHVGPINFLTNAYPYGDLQLGQVIGKHYWSDDMNANANYWATDGLAACGLPGIIISSLILFCIFIFFNTITKKYDKKVLLLLFIPYIFSLTNTSLFTTMLSNGGFLLLLFLLFKKENILKMQNT